MGTKIAVIGAGSTYTPELVDGLARRIDRLPIDELVLLDIEPERLEVVGGLALVAGFRTRLTATALAVFTLATAILFHNSMGDQNQMIHFLKNIAITGGLLQVIAFGAGAFSLDNRRRSASVPA